MAPITAALRDDSAHGAGAARISLDLSRGQPLKELLNGVPFSASQGNGAQKAPARQVDGAPQDPLLQPGTAEWALHVSVTEIDKRDADTPDRWVPRHPDLIRLTGRHPFNVEPPPGVLHQRGFLTPVSLHYVRNHGAVPRLAWTTHRVTVKGLVARPVEFTMDQLVELFPPVTVTATLTCAGNRRKEQNMVKKTIGFNWGPAGTACGEWTGVRLADILAHCGVAGPAAGSHHVAFRGPKGELPQGADGSYGTSIPLSKALDPASDVILAYRHNGRLLTPDHGYPVRIIIPGYIGGRMVKWLEEIVVQPQESDNFYHFHDNRVLPSHVDEALAKKEGWWYKPDFIINDLNINSALVSPAHDEVLPLAGTSSYPIRGYAYCGGGRKVIRCEVSLDDGASWRLANIERHEQPNAYGRYYAWVFWQLHVPIVDLLCAPELICRAWDDSMNTQPNTFTWNVMGMMNNCVYRVKVAAVDMGARGPGLQFEHPTIAGATVGGWMNRAGDVQQAAASQAVAMPLPTAAAGTQRMISMAEVEQHSSKESAWFVRGGKVYDGTAFLADHPGGADSILLVAGQDATDEFDAIHSDKAKAQLEAYCIGDLASSEALPGTSAAVAVTPSANSAAAVAIRTMPAVNDTAPIANGTANGSATAANGTAVAAGMAAAESLVALDPRKRQKFKLLENFAINHNTRRFRFALPSAQHRFGLPVGKHIFLYAKVNDELVVRAYTPTSSDDDLGYFDLVIKVYWANEHPRFPAGGKMSQRLESLKVGDDMEVKGPLGHFHWLGRGTYTLDGAPRRAAHVSMIAGGTGITPMYQVIKAILKDPQDSTRVSLLYANQSPADILLREELEAMAADERVSVWYTVDRVPEGTCDWPYSTGFVDEAMVQQRLFPSSPDTICLMCGPPPMIKFACLPNLEKAGYTPEQCISF